MTAIEVEGEPVDQVSNFFYLVANISGHRMIDRDLQIREIRRGGDHVFFTIWPRPPPPPPKKMDLETQKSIQSAVGEMEQHLNYKNSS